MSPAIVTIITSLGHAVRSIDIREHRLQDPQNRRMIKADDRLKAVFNGLDAVNMFEMTKLVNQNLSEPPPAQPAPPAGPAPTG